MNYLKKDRFFVYDYLIFRVLFISYIFFIYIIKENHFLQVVDEFYIDLNIILWYNSLSFT